MPWRAQSLQEEMISLQKLIRTSSTFIYPQYCVLLGNNFSQLIEIFFDYKDTFCVLVTILTLFYLAVFIYSSSFMLCFSFNMFKYLECLCCFLFFHKNCIFAYSLSLWSKINLIKIRSMHLLPIFYWFFFVSATKKLEAQVSLYHSPDINKPS